MFTQVTGLKNFKVHGDSAVFQDSVKCREHVRDCYYNYKFYCNSCFAYAFFITVVDVKLQQLQELQKLASEKAAKL